MKISDEFINNAITFDGFLPEDIGEYASKAGAIKRGWQAVGQAFSDINGWETRQLDDGFPCLMPIGAEDRTASYIYVGTNEYGGFVLNACICTEIDPEWGEPYYAVYQATYAGDLITLLIAFGV